MAPKAGQTRVMLIENFASGKAVLQKRLLITRSPSQPWARLTRRYGS